MELLLEICVFVDSLYWNCLKLIFINNINWPRIADVFERIGFFAALELIEIFEQLILAGFHLKFTVTLLGSTL